MWHKNKHEHAAYYCFRFQHGFIHPSLLEVNYPYCCKQASQVINITCQNRGEISLHLLICRHLFPSQPTLTSNHPCTDKYHQTLHLNIFPNGNCSPHSMWICVRYCGFDECTYKHITVYRGENAVTHFIEALLEEN